MNIFNIILLGIKDDKRVVTKFLEASNKIGTMSKNERANYITDMINYFDNYYKKPMCKK